MVKFRNWHKYAGLASAAVLFLLAVTGFFLDHKNWSFLYTTTISNTYLPDAVVEKEKHLFENYWINPDDNTVVIGGKRGLFYTKDHKEFLPVLGKQCLSLRYDEVNRQLFAATDDGLYSSTDGKSWRPFLLQGEYVNAISIYQERLMAVVEKKNVYIIDLQKQAVIEETAVHIDESELQHSIKLSRYVRDFHYGRGLFDGGWSLLINDISAIILALLSVSGLLIWYLIKKVRSKQKNYAKGLKPAIKAHGNIFAVIVVIPLILFSLTGIILDHSKFFGQYINHITIPHAILPPVYDTLEEDIWSVDLDVNSYRIGNRYGVYKSDDLKRWTFENRGLAYRMKRFDSTLLVSGMGAPNRIYTEDAGWKILPKTPHMFKDVWVEGSGYHFFACRRPDVPTPDFSTTTLYSLMDALHDGTFFAPWWVYVNDIASVLLLILLFTGTMRWAKKKKGLFKR